MEAFTITNETPSEYKITVGGITYLLYVECAFVHHGAHPVGWALRREEDHCDDLIALFNSGNIFLLIARALKEIKKLTV